MKIALELNLPGDGRTFLNFWNWRNGDDVICRIIDGRLMLQVYDNAGEEMEPREITLAEFVRMVEERS